MASLRQPVWIFDLDDTLHNASAHIFPVMNRAMTQYIQDYLSLDYDQANQLRQHYWRIYGATLKGLMRHHGVNPHHFLHHTHQLDLPEMVIRTERLKHLIQQLPGRKCIFTNAPKAYARKVLALLQIADCFELVFSVESSQFHAKPSQRAFARILKVLKVNASQCIMIEDSKPALMTAKRLGMRTIWVTKRPCKPNFVDFRLSSVFALTHLKL